MRLREVLSTWLSFAVIEPLKFTLTSNLLAERLCLFDPKEFSKGSVDRCEGNTIKTNDYLAS